MPNYLPVFHLSCILLFHSGGMTLNGWKLKIRLLAFCFFPIFRSHALPWDGTNSHPKHFCIFYVDNIEKLRISLTLTRTFFAVILWNLLLDKDLSCNLLICKICSLSLWCWKVAWDYLDHLDHQNEPQTQIYIPRSQCSLCWLEDSSYKWFWWLDQKSWQFEIKLHIVGAAANESYIGSIEGDLGVYKRLGSLHLTC